MRSTAKNVTAVASLSVPVLEAVSTGAQVLVHYGRGAKEAEAVVAQIRKAGSRADAIAADLAAPDGPQRLAKQVRAIVGDRLARKGRDRTRGVRAI
jgi:NAD(P)-dependent dehydrogenase (short-subunit alcohol dehydrogenase family)